MRYCFDIDNTICDTIGNDYKNSKPKKDVITEINRLHSIGHYVIMMTARGKSSGIDWTEFTQNQLKEWNLHYDELLMNVKPNADIFIDDKAMNSVDWIRQSITPMHGVVAGAFDLIHPGYIRLLNFCKTKCDKLTVALHNNPNLQRNYKLKPILTIKERMEVLSSLKQVDSVVMYETENDLINLLNTYKFDVRFLGTEYKHSNTITGKDIIPIIFHERDHDWSYTNLCKKILERDKHD